MVNRVIQFSELIQKLGKTAEQNSIGAGHSPDPSLAGITAIEEALPGTLSYIEGGKFTAQITITAASALILPLDSALQAQATARGIAWIASSQPRLLFAQAIALFYQPFQPELEIHPTAVIHPTAQIGSGVYIGPYAVIQANVTLGNGVCIYPHVVIYPEAQIGDRTILHANCVIHERSHIGANCVVHSGAVIGAEGFGFVPTPEGWYKMQQSGCTVLEDGVEIGCNSSVDRPAVGETRIGRNTKIDNLVQIGHGCRIGKNCAIAAQVGIAGGAKLGDRVLLAGQVGIAWEVAIGDNVTATARAGIISDIEPGMLVSGHPTVPHRQWLRVSALQGRLPELYQMLKDQQKQLDVLQLLLANNRPQA
jgi:UDP-3-O-[3-hydroxymyristoyl] glucosamine N-acyltransferase